MKSILLKSLSIVALIIAFGCSDEQTLQPIEEETQNIKLQKAEKAALNQAGRRSVHTIIVVCPNGGTFGPVCDFGLDPSVTVYSYMQSPNCPDVYMVWVDSLEYYAIYSVPPTGTRHTHLPPYNDDPPYFPYADYDNCFN